MLRQRELNVTRAARRDAILIARRQREEQGEPVGHNAARDAAAEAERALRLKMGMHAESLSHVANFKSRMESWERFSGAAFSNLAACSVCGVVSLGGPGKGWTIDTEDLNHDDLPASCANPFLTYFCGEDGGAAHLCKSCSKKSDDAVQELERTAIGRHHLVYTSTRYLRALLSCHPLRLHMLSILDARMNLVRHWQGFSVGTMSARSLLVSPIINWDAVDITHVQYDSEHDGGVGWLLAVNLRTNPIYKKYRCMLEQTSLRGTTGGINVVPSAAVERFVSDHMERNPIAESRMGSDDPVDRGTLSVMDDIMPIPCTGKMTPPKHYAAGCLQLRDSDALRGRRMPLLVDGQGQQVANMVVQAEQTSTLEACLFPYLFPNGVGFWRPPGRTGPRSPFGTLQAYLKYRMKTLFSSFTLCKPYLLMMYQVRISCSHACTLS